MYYYQAVMFSHVRDNDASGLGYSEAYCIYTSGNYETTVEIAKNHLKEFVGKNIEGRRKSYIRILRFEVDSLTAQPSQENYIWYDGENAQEKPSCNHATDNRD